MTEGKRTLEFLDKVHIAGLEHPGVIVVTIGVEGKEEPFGFALTAERAIEIGLNLMNAGEKEQVRKIQDGQP